ncbi:hypothetical protein N9I38_04050 [Gammaproteobacteria bacterium]|nr:hypothetical protein [Gammaproteobacteria bacterium]
MPKDAFTKDASAIKAATEVTGVTALKSEWPVSLLTISKLSKALPESRSVPPKLIRFPSEYLIVNLPSLSEVVVSSSASAV